MVNKDEYIENPTPEIRWYLFQPPGECSDLGSGLPLLKLWGISTYSMATFVSHQRSCT